MKEFERVELTLYQEILVSFQKEFDFVPCMANGTKAII